MDSLKELALRYVYEGILISDTKGNIVFVNQQYCRVTGLKHEEIIGRNLQDLLDERLINRAISLDVIRERKIITTQHHYVSGKEALSTAVPIYDNGEFVGVVNTTRNISKLVQLKEEVQEDSEGLTRRFAQEIDLYRNILNRNINFVYASKVMEQTVQSAKKVAPFDTTVQIYGDSGTGKEVLARFIHQQSKRCDGPFIKVNCAAIPAELFESELFGYVDGAFTGANKKGKLGLFEAANEGTLLLDEVGELSLDMQSKLLRVIQEQEIYRIGSEEPIKINVRILSATNKNLAQEVREGKFREDLFFRLNVFPISIAPLKQRQEDIPLLIDYVLEKLNRKYKTTKVISKEARETLMNYDYPGNVRELENIMEYIFVMSGQKIELETIPGKVLSKVMLNTVRSKKHASRGLRELVDLYEKTILEDVIRQYDNLRDAASVLQIHHTTLQRKMQKYHLKFSK